MPVVFGSINKEPVSQALLTPPKPQHPRERYAELRLVNLQLGAWSSRSVGERDVIFSGTVNGKSLACICDAELTNARQISQLLVSHGLPIQSDGHAELVAMCVAAFGAEAFAQMDGAFRCAVWYDDRLYLATDRFGAKRLSYLETDQAFYFCSRVDWLGGFSPEISLQAVSLYIQMAFIPTPRTIFQNVKRLSSGSCLTWDGKVCTVRQYWAMRYTEDLRGPESQMAEQLRERLESSVERTVVGLSSERSGCYLSGGTDSSTVLGMAAKAWGKTPESYTIGFAEEEFSETYYSRMAARHFGAKANEKIIDERDGWRAVPKLVDAFDQPFGNSSSVGAYFCAEMAAANSVEVMLAGDAGDELFGGNERYAKDKVYRTLGVLPTFAYKNILWGAVWSATHENAGAIRLKNILHRATLKNPERFYMEDTSTPGLGPDFYSAALRTTMDSEMPLDIMRGYYSEVEAKSELNRLLYIDLKLTITDNDLVKVTDTAAACGVRVRYPFLDRELVEFSSRMPVKMKLKGLDKRYLFKRSLRGFLPAEILKKTKHGFGVPVSTWFRKDRNFRELIQDITSDRLTRQRGYLDPVVLDSVVDQHQRGLRDWGQLLWALMILELWQRRVSSGD